MKWVNRNILLWNKKFYHPFFQPIKVLLASAGNMCVQCQIFGIKCGHLSYTEQKMLVFFQNIIIQHCSFTVTYIIQRNNILLLKCNSNGWIITYFCLFKDVYIFKKLVLKNFIQEKLQIKRYPSENSRKVTRFYSSIFFSILYELIFL